MERAKNLETLLTICTGLLIFYLIFDIQVLIIIAIVLGLIGMFFNYLAGKITWAWMKLAEGMGFVSSKILLSAVFFVFLMPVAFLSKLFSKTTNLQLRRKPEGSYFANRNHEYTRNDLENVW